MLLPTMSDEEVTIEIIYDLLELRKQNGTRTRLVIEYDKMRRKLKVPLSSTFIKVIPIKTKKKNMWLFFLSKAPSVKNYKGIESINILQLVYYYTNIGLRAFKISPDSNGGERPSPFSVFNSHLFTRYAERLGLNIPDPIKLIEHFFTKNGYFSIKFNEKAWLATCSEGMILGEIQCDGRWIVFKTFITDQQMFPDQTEEEMKLISWMQAEIEAELNKDQFDKTRHDYFADTLLGVKKTSRESQ